MKIKERKKYRIFQCIEVITSIIVWACFVYILYNHGYKKEYTPIRLGILSLAFSGTIAVCNAIFPIIMKPKKEKIYIGVAFLFNLPAIFMMVRAERYSLVLLSTVFICGCYSCISCAKANMMLSHIGIKDDKFIFRLFRVGGPIFGGIVAGLMENNFIFLISLITAMGFVTNLFVPNNVSILKQDDINEKEDAGKSGKVSDIDIRGVLVLVGFLTFCIQVIDAQLVTLFRYVIEVSAFKLGLSVGFSGIGVFVISSIVETYIKKLWYCYSALLGMGILLITIGQYIKKFNRIEIVYLLIFFLIGGLFWQIVMSVLENKINNFEDPLIRQRYSNIVGVTLIITYSLGAVCSGFLVNSLGIYYVYTILGGVLTVATGSYIIFSVLRRSKLGKFIRGKKFNEKI